MFYVLSKLLGWVAQPLSVVILCLLIAYLKLWRTPMRGARRLIGIALAILLLGGVSPLANVLLLPLEDRFARPSLPADAVIDGILVLGGAEDSRISAGRHVVALNEAAERMTEAAALARRFPQARLVFTGGTSELLLPSTYGADAARLYFEAEGIASARLTFEDQARNTWENAVLTQALTKPKPGERWLLVTSGYHMARAVGCLRRIGWPVIPWPVDYRTSGPRDLVTPFYSPADALRRLEVGTKGWNVLDVDAQVNVLMLTRDVGEGLYRVTTDDPPGVWEPGH